MENYHVHISAQKRWFELNLKEVWRYRDLIILFTKRSFALTYKQTVLGPAWLFLNPLITSVIYTFVFGNIAGMSTDGVPHILFYMSSNALWTFFALCVNSNAATFTRNAHVFGKVYFPRLTIPFSNVLSAIIRFGIQMSMILVILIYYLATKQVSPNWASWFTIPVLLVHLGMMGMGVGIIISSMTTKYRDLSILVGFGVSLWMYASPVIYPISTMSESWMRIIMVLNPVSAPMELFRYAVVGKGQILYGSMIWSWIFTLIVVVFGIMIFNRVEKTFMDTV
ncbi:MAG: ABC transporter permease [Parasporobacterium sp.]|nr:ABC transporter permease [Parasporobacterium sp.]